MLKNIKSKYFIELLFSFIDERVKLKSVKYNKMLQKAININIMNYKLFIRRYIIYEENNKRKEYNCFNNNLIFEGEYLKGQRHGKGKEYYDNGCLQFEGEYLNGKRHDKGKEYYRYNYDIFFETEYLDGRKIGRKGKEYCKGKLLFEGEYLNGKKCNGKGYDNNGNIIYELKKGTCVPFLLPNGDAFFLWNEHFIRFFDVECFIPFVEVTDLHVSP